MGVFVCHVRKAPRQRQNDNGTKGCRDVRRWLSARHGAFQNHPHLCALTGLSQKPTAALVCLPSSEQHRSLALLHALLAIEDFRKSPSEENKRDERVHAAPFTTSFCFSSRYLSLIPFFDVSLSPSFSRDACKQCMIAV